MRASQSGRPAAFGWDRRERRRRIMAMEIETNGLIAEHIEACTAAKLFDPEIDADLLAHQLMLMSHGWALKAWRLKPAMGLRAYVDESLRLAFGGVLTPLGRRRLKVPPWPDEKAEA